MISTALSPQINNKILFYKIKHITLPSPYLMSLTGSDSFIAVGKIGPRWMLVRWREYSILI